MTVIDKRLRAKRTVVECDAGWAVTDSEFVTTDWALADAVAVELDRVEPLERAITGEEARSRIDQIIGDMEHMLDRERPDHERIDALRHEADVLIDHLRRAR